MTTVRHHSLLLRGEDGGMKGFRYHRGIRRGRPLSPLLHGRRADPVPTGEGLHTLFTLRYRSTDRLSRPGAAVQNLAHRSSAKHDGQASRHIGVSNIY